MLPINLTESGPFFFISKLQKYGDPVEAGIVDLGDSPGVRQQKLEKCKQTARDEMKKGSDSEPGTWRCG
jgi:hypothetical protein